MKFHYKQSKETELDKFVDNIQQNEESLNFIHIGLSSVKLCITKICVGIKYMYVKYYMKREFSCTYRLIH